MEKEGEGVVDAVEGGIVFGVEGGCCTIGGLEIEDTVFTSCVALTVLLVVTSRWVSKKF